MGPGSQPRKAPFLQGKENQRNVINLDENEDTFHNQEEFARIFSKGETLKK